jgi:hypothetical protein
MKNPNLIKNMPHVKWDQIPPTKGPESQGLQPKRFKTVLTLPKKPVRSL